ncbi:uncharacterized protein LOC115386591 isoform X1 [Salarias fasciatus]|uniref:uncharacterized protein LOC115386591 isoform X1 n=1 Tax=Salarias fasciatus TaxID=181472 RepID=UPI001176C734|nr:uncharacterized protein LOC115386591 isoform X1 [Salarias fasciatus]
MNGAVYISFFQGQLESVLEQVVQLAVQEISKSVGSSLNALLLETAVKEQENRRLRVQLQSRDTRGRASDGGSPVAGKHKAGKAMGDERTDGGRTKPEQPPQQLHAPGGQGPEPGVHTDTRRLEQRGRVVDQLKSVMEQVLDFAVRELTKIVEASFDDLLLEITKMEREQHALEERLGKGPPERGGSEKGRAGGRRRGSENDSVSPSGSEDTREEAEVPVSKKTAEKDDPEPPPVLSVSQDWVPILDKVFGQKWCSDVWQIKELAGDGGEGGGGGRGLGEAGAHRDEVLSAPSVTLEPSPSSPQQDPRWTPLEDMEVFSPDEDEAEAAAAAAAATAPQTDSNAATTTPGAGAPSSPSGRRSSASMLQRLLTLPSQLLEDEEGEDPVAKETLVVLTTDGAADRRADADPPDRPTRGAAAAEEEEAGEDEEEEEEEDKGRKQKKRRRMWSECEECGRRFSRMSLLKAHRHTHGNAAADTASPSPPPAAAASSLPLHCSECGKRFSSATRLHSHTRTQHPGNRS